MSRQKPRMSSEGAADPALAETKKARHRLVGAVALCLLAAIVVPMLLESEPRNGARELPITVESAFESTTPDRPWIEPPALAPDEGGTPHDRIVMLEEGAVGQPPARSETDPPLPLEPAPVSPVPPPQASPQAHTPPRPGAQPPAARQPQRPAPPPRPAAPAQDDRPDVLGRLINQVDQPSGQRPPAERRVVRRFLVQVGAYSNVKSARLATERVGKAGLTAYQETVKTANGDWIRVRVGPFGSREEAEQAQAALKRAGVTAALIAL